MREIVAFASYAGYALIVFTAISALNNAWKRRDAHRLNILFVVLTLAVLPRLRGRGPVLDDIGVALLLALPYFLLRLVHHFRDVSAALLAGTLAVVLVGAGLYAAAPASRSPLWYSAIAGYVAAGHFYVAVAFTREAMRTSGVTAKRLVFAAAATWFFAAVFALGSIAEWSGVLRLIGQVNQLLAAAGLTCYFLAFSTPRRLRASWQRTEQAKYLSSTAGRDAEDRGAKAPDDLLQASVRSVGNSLTLVALRGPQPDGSDHLLVRATTDPAFAGLALVPGTSLVGMAARGGQAVSGAIADCGPELSGRLGAFGTSALVAPITTETHNWGIVLVAQRRGSLFPEDDLLLLAALGRYAAMALDHAHLLAERRERERKAADRRLREVESRMGLMFDSIKDYAMFVLDHRGVVVTWQPGAEHVFGYLASEMRDQAAAPLFDLQPDAFLALLATARRAGHAERDGPCRRRDGSRFIGTTVVRPLRSDVDDLDGFVAVTHDVTERRDLEDRLRQSQKMEAIGQLAGGIAHDFNNLLTAILGYSDWLAHDLRPDDSRRLQVAEIQKAAERAAGLTRQLLAFSRRQMLQPTSINLTQLVDDLVPMLRRVIGEHIQIVPNLARDLAPVLGDRGQLEQIVINLAVNSRDAMPNGGRLTLTTKNVSLGGPIGSSAGDPYVEFDVTDTGIGMDEATMARIFEPFFTTKDLGRGTGLGLATVYGIVQQMDGHIKVESVLRHGATFRLYFPAAETAAAAVAAPATSVPAGRRRGRETLLLVEDDEAVRVFLTEVLERHGYEVMPAEHQNAALAMVEATNGPIHLVITDVVMPGGTGPELARALEAMRPGVPVLYISGYADAVLAQEGTLPKATHFLQKPFLAGDLLTRIAQILMPSL